MPIEIEAKMRLDDVHAMAQTLRANDAEYERTVMERNTFFDTPEHTLKSFDQGLRIRSETCEETGEQKTIITHKGPRAHGKLKNRPETEAIVADPASAADLLVALGFQPELTFEKRREYWRLGDCEIVVDQVPYLGDFMEIEGPDEQAVLAVRDQLGLSDAPLIRASYIAMLSTYLREKKIHDEEILLDRAAVLE